MGGGFQGNNTECETADTCPIAGEGDECTSAMFASFGTNAFETNSATASADQPDSSQCSGTYLDWDNSQMTFGSCLHQNKAAQSTLPLVMEILTILRWSCMKVIVATKWLAMVTPMMVVAAKRTTQHSITT